MKRLLAAYVLLTGAVHPHVLTIVLGHLSWGVWWRMGFLAIGGTLIAGWLQVWGQRRLSATEAALAFNLEPVWTAIFAWLVLSQWLNWLKLLGAALIIASLAALSAAAGENTALDVPGHDAPYREH